MAKIKSSEVLNKREVEVENEMRQQKRQWNSLKMKGEEEGQH